MTRDMTPARSLCSTEQAVATFTLVCQSQLPKIKVVSSGTLSNVVIWSASRESCKHWAKKDTDRVDVFKRYTKIPARPACLYGVWLISS